MISVLILIVIYFAFISLGLPDSLIGAAWPSMFGELNVPVSYAGIISVFVAFGSIISSLLSDYLIKKLHTEMVTTISIFLTAISLLVISFSNNYLLILLMAIPLGLGGGSIDAALNNYVSLHYKAIHMNFLHAFWGIGTIVGPIIISAFLSKGGTWKNAYFALAMVQLSIGVISALSIPLWVKERKSFEPINEEDKKPISLLKALKLKKAVPTALAFFSYCSLESSMILWSSTFLVMVKGIDVANAALYSTLLYVGITSGRLISGFLSLKVNEKTIIFTGISLIPVGLLIIILPFTAKIMPAIGLLVVGMGCAPIYPGLMHQTPITFGKDKSQALTGIEMAAAYLGNTISPAIFGFIGRGISFKLLPYYAILFFVIHLSMVLMILKKDHTKTQ